MAQLSHVAARNIVIGGMVLFVLLFIVWAAHGSDSVLVAGMGIAFVILLVLGLKYGEGGNGDAGGGL